ESRLSFDAKLRKVTFLVETDFLVNIGTATVLPVAEVADDAAIAAHGRNLRAASLALEEHLVVVGRIRERDAGKRSQQGDGKDSHVFPSDGRWSAWAGNPATGTGRDDDADCPLTLTAFSTARPRRSRHRASSHRIDSFRGRAADA